MLDAIRGGLLRTTQGKNFEKNESKVSHPRAFILDKLTDNGVDQSPFNYVLDHHCIDTDEDVAKVLLKQLEATTQCRVSVAYKQVCFFNCLWAFVNVQLDKAPPYNAHEYGEGQIYWVHGNATC